MDASLCRPSLFSACLMTKHIDIPLFIKSCGDLNLLAIVSEAFLRQVPSWRTDFCKITETYDVDALADLLHKMKGSCYAISAHGVAAAFNLAERNIRNGNQKAWPRQSSILLDLMDQIELELRAIISGSSE
jgi:hypothetical protein